ncbi:MAG: class II glutamine amidotransferase [Deltaproteobacteria bacterium]|nr:class II glutamine amidotransferase [Deltaproteobacteria bacterium]
MARLLGLIGNRPDLCNRFADHERRLLHWHRDDPEIDWAWGVGFYQAGEVLLKRRPIDERTELDIADMIPDVRSDILITHVRRATVGDLRTDNTHPFRYRQWMFADTGTVDDFGSVRERLLEALPTFLRRSLRGDTDSELLFHLFLSFLHDAGKLDFPTVTPEDVFPALKSSLALLDRIGREAEVEPSSLNIMLATPEYLIAAHRGAPMAYRLLKGREDFEPLFAGDGPSKLRMPDLEPCRLAVVASDFQGGDTPEGWTALAQGSMAAFKRTGEPTIVGTSS